MIGMHKFSHSELIIPLFFSDKFFPITYTAFYWTVMAKYVFYNPSSVISFLFSLETICSVMAVI